MILDASPMIGSSPATMRRKGTTLDHENSKPQQACKVGSFHQNRIYQSSMKSLSVTISNSDDACVLVRPMNSTAITLTGFEAPRLASRLVDSTHMQLSWSVPVPGYNL